MAARKKSRARQQKGRARTELRRGDTRDPGSVGNVGCWVIAAAVVLIALMIVLFEFVL
ncbi:hypothetical protein J4H86_14000 [Spiractinospora alimapuensis]|uniref:hypothetical protein n=1 Tax=Spiractinospora alimapuensis TaxID=2820884 RepID=UPI001F1EA43B|nr:hypothetical protein [Spiractinospora alimapuensis]QVQ50082.1 hypothetical protein J4H86_14000 [Spiractinospora alimapuensis]